MSRRLDPTGQRFGHLTVIEPAEKLNGRTAWVCQCDCGKQCVVQTKQLRNGHTISCGHVKQNPDHSIRPGFEAKRVNGVAAFLLDSDRRKVRSDSTTGITGVKVVTYRDGSKHYAAEITVKGKRKRIGTFKTVGEATRARLQAEDKLKNNKFKL